MEQRPINGVKSACKSTAMISLLSFAMLLALLLALSSQTGQVDASALSAPSKPDAPRSNSMPSGSYNLDNLISDFLNDASNRLKKSKLNSVRQIKPTLRFGRRSDPLMAPEIADQLAALESEDSYEQNQRRLLAAALAAAAASAQN